MNENNEVIEQIMTWLTDKGLDVVYNAAVAILMLLAGWLVIWLAAKMVRKAIERHGKGKTLLANFVVSVATKAMWAFLIVMVLGRVGVDVGPLIAGLGVTGFILGFAFQESLGNLAAGMMIALNDPFKKGDFVTAGGHEGVISEVNMMATVMLTGDNKKIVLPNKTVWGGAIVNYSTLGKRRVDMVVGIAYGDDVEKAVRVLSEASVKVPGVLAEPAPSVSVAGLEDSAVTINVRPWSTSADYWGVRSAALVAAKAALEDAGLHIPFPQLDVHQI